MIEKWADAANLQNVILKKEGKIDRNDKRIWGLVLHDWDNNDWMEVLKPMSTLIDKFPEFAEPYHVTNIREAMEAKSIGYQATQEEGLESSYDCERNMECRKKTIK